MLQRSGVLMLMHELGAPNALLPGRGRNKSHIKSHIWHPRAMMQRKRHCFNFNPAAIQDKSASLSSPLASSELVVRKRIR